MTDILGAFVQFWYKLPEWVHLTVLTFVFISILPPVIHVLIDALGKGNYHSDFTGLTVDNHNYSEPLNNITLIDFVNEVIPLNCVNCGASLNGNSVCEYCGTVYNSLSNGGDNQ